MADGQDLTAATEAAWSELRRRLADHVAAMDEGDVVVATYADALDPEVEASGAAPYVQLVAFGDDDLRLEAVSDTYLDDALLLSAEQEEHLLDLGWDAPTFEPGDDNFHGFAERREADRVAVLLVRTLREVYGVPHPAVLECDALGLPEPADAPDLPDVEAAPEPERGVPHGPDHLQELVDTAMREVFPDLVHDDDGDIPVVAGQSVAFVQVLPDRPAVAVHAQIVRDPVDRDRVPFELGLLNRAHPQWQFVVLHGHVVMRQELLAVPFSGLQLRSVVQRFVREVDGIAEELAERIGGRRFLEEDEDDELDEIEPGLPYDELDVAQVGLVGLGELLHLGRPRSATVAGLFDHHRVELTRALHLVRAGEIVLDEHDVDDVVSALRRALRHLADVQGSPLPLPLPPKPRRLRDDSEEGRVG